MLETVLKKLVEQLERSNDLKEKELATLAEGKPILTVVGDPPEPEEEPEESEEEEAQEEKPETPKKRARKSASKKAKKKPEPEPEEEEEDDDYEDEEEEEETALTHADIRRHLRTTMKKLVGEHGPSAKAVHQAEYKEHLKDAGYKKLDEVPEDELPEFLEDLKNREAELDFE